ncbi:MAG TPA: hypothetical protein VN175_11845, partial [Rhizomicrobium sp.]|nr:hypothetical protein [Rhizomicrobium sp.]
AESPRERQLFSMILNLSSAFGEMQEAILVLANSSAMDEATRADVKAHSEKAAVQFMELISRARDYQSLEGPLPN